MVRKSKKLPRHLIVYRTSAMGDVAMLAHALRALKRATADRTVLSISHRGGADTGRLIPIGEES